MTKKSENRDYCEDNWWRRSEKSHNFDAVANCLCQLLASLQRLRQVTPSVDGVAMVTKTPLVGGGPEGTGGGLVAAAAAASLLLRESLRVPVPLLFLRAATGQNRVGVGTVPV